MATYKSAVREAELQLEAAEKSMQLAKLFMMEIAQLESVDLYMNYESEMPDEVYESYKSGVERMLKDEPMQYILGYEWFYGRKFKVNQDVLIPRPETEELVSNVLVAVDERTGHREEPLTLIDVGCGSGAIGLSLKLEEPSLQVTLGDISAEALVVAKENATTLEAEVDFVCGDMLQPFIDQGIKVDVLVCNPPYIPSTQEIEATVKDYEPNVALFGGNDGLYFYKKVFDTCHLVLKEHALMAFEIGYDQKEALLQEATTRFPQAKCEVLQDMYGKDRMLFVDFK
ncbi:MAG: peptide chain release factor N(5)-glutamine methyltransferase [Erysipelotrichaceae bacterium]|nr:peptide chain release factor N(5)-glutamine methyltransferase [Erysipelotrichaceae bacterium]